MPVLINVEPVGNLILCQILFGEKTILVPLASIMSLSLCFDCHIWLYYIYIILWYYQLQHYHAGIVQGIGPILCRSVNVNFFQLQLGEYDDYNVHATWWSVKCQPFSVNRKTQAISHYPVESIHPNQNEVIMVNQQQRFFF